MKWNICSECFGRVISLEHIMSAEEWGNCEICGSTGVFYARKDELENAKESYDDYKISKDISLKDELSISLKQ